MKLVFVSNKITLIVIIILTQVITCEYVTRDLLCNEKICDSVGGRCIDERTCACNENYTTFYIFENFKYCNYLKKSSLIAGFLELFLGLGVGHLYAGRKINGIIKMIICTTCCCIGCSFLAIGMKLQQQNPNIASSPIIQFFLKTYAILINSVLVWQFFDFLLFVSKFYTDGHNLSLY
jgi:hypothetical protein